MDLIEPDSLDRIQKLSLDTGEATSLSEAREIFSRYVLQVDVQARTEGCLTAEAALCTILNAAPRAFQGGVRVRLFNDFTLQGGWLRGRTASHALTTFGCESTDQLSDDYPTLVVGHESSKTPPTGGPCIYVVHAGWSGGIVQDPQGFQARDQEFPPAGVLAGAIGVAEAFQILRGNVRAGRRDQGMSLWRPDLFWQDPQGSGPHYKGLLIPNKLHVLGLGHLGQAYLWTLGWLPFVDPARVEVTLQDSDYVTLANMSTSLLASQHEIGSLKTRVIAERLERRGLSTRILERRFDEFQRVGYDDPSVAVVGVDNPQTRALIGGAGWRLILDCGLGAGAQDYLDAHFHRFPADATPAGLWGDKRGTFDDHLLEQPAYVDMERRMGDRCGVVMIAGRAVGAAFVGAWASAVTVSELARYYATGSTQYQVISSTLRDLAQTKWVPLHASSGPLNLGWVEL